MRTRPIIIAHRGASGYLPEHTLESKALAFGMGADFLEQDVVATGDGQLVVFHDLTLEQTSDVAARFPGRARADGHFYCIDFALEELRSLTLMERRVSGGTAPRYPGRFPDGAVRFRIVTLEEEIRFIRGLVRSTGRTVGIYPEIKNPAWHLQAGMDVGAKTLEILDRHGYHGPGDDVFVQCFEPAELQRLRKDFGCRLRLVQLLDATADIASPGIFAKIAGYADAVGPSIGLIYRGMDGDSRSFTSLIDHAHDAGLAVHPYTFRKDDLPAGVATFRDLLELFLTRLGADGIFTDFPDLAVEYVRDQFSV